MTAAAEAKHLQPPAPHPFQILLLHFAFLFGIFCCVTTGLTPVPWHMALVHAAAGCTGPFGVLPNDVQQRVQSAAAASGLLGKPSDTDWQAKNAGATVSAGRHMNTVESGEEAGIAAHQLTATALRSMPGKGLEVPAR